MACVIGLAAAAQEFSALARLDMGASKISDTENGVTIALRLSQGVPYRVFTLDAPERLVLDFREVDWGTGDPDGLIEGSKVTQVRVGGFRAGWSRMVVDLAGPYLLDSVALDIDVVTGAADLEVVLKAGTAQAFTVRAGAPVMPGWDLPQGALAAQVRPRQRGEGPLVIVLDPGHGGIDPGAEQGDLREKDLMLGFARELKEALIRAGDYQVVLTRQDDSFVSLERRVAIAHRVGADLMISLHADVLSDGRARGVTIYTLSESASDKASAALAERHDRADILAGIDLSGTDDVVADVLMDLARMETRPRAEALSKALEAGIGKYQLPLNSRPRRAAGFSVLKSPDIPSILLELGFLSSPKDLKNLRDPVWRQLMAAGVVDALAAWRISDAAAAELVRQ